MERCHLKCRKLAQSWKALLRGWSTWISPLKGVTQNQALYKVCGQVFVPANQMQVERLEARTTSGPLISHEDTIGNIFVCEKALAWHNIYAELAKPSKDIAIFAFYGEVYTKRHHPCAWIKPLHSREQKPCDTLEGRRLYYVGVTGVAKALPLEIRMKHATCVTAGWIYYYGCDVFGHWHLPDDCWNGCKSYPYLSWYWLNIGASEDFELYPMKINNLKKYLRLGWARSYFLRSKVL